MKRFFPFFLSFLVILSLACFASSKIYAKTQILATSYSNYVLLLNLFYEDDEVELQQIFKESTSCPEESELSVLDMKLMSEAQYLVYDKSIGEEKLLRFTKKFASLEMLDSSLDVEFVFRNHQHAGKEVKERDPHFFLSLSNMIKQVKNLEKSFIQIFPSKKERLTKNAGAYIQKIEALRGQSLKLQEKLSSYVFVLEEEAFFYLKDDLKLKIKNLESVHSHSHHTDFVSESAKELKVLSEVLKEKGSVFIFSLKLKAKAKTLERETGAKSVMLDLIESNLSLGKISDKDYYLRSMKSTYDLLNSLL